MQAIILCGELATRPGESTKDILKILLEITGQTVLAWQLQMLKQTRSRRLSLRRDTWLM